MRPTAILIAACSLLLAPASAANDVAAAVSRVLDDFHDAAAEADEARYFGHLAPDAIFLGTDATERWTVDGFREFAHPHFAAGRGWTYVATERYVMASADGTLAWFDEKLRNDKYGQTRGTGVLRRTDAGWKIVHYSLTMLVPNERSAAVVEAIRGREAPPPSE